ncbi:tripartite tricarboxylate transporter TctB family protein [Cellulomonas sp. zg-ZUI199]|uniref:Tripartite tricarboxylate transporter TctB family protein n=1 Tax=Cellulomonas wangleii TaxID=2816956 RepID=A0ABX8D3W8_9CELL|nr:tripartite tricarboxylate transporter TctB family protein [Cellulomonas wangleii]MBO0923847.1 tripartite tricarboxylate transporter TctB family protein [Cellulomonas wangleii]MBO0924129.1 tripartite tricarboxylate transporter TctB family protein [Cellulomonas wangleii]QVI62154.1 tripartite tricarboxylate transporter TctB family protein [Cellulomonas wangleii]
MSAAGGVAGAAGRTPAAGPGDDGVGAPAPTVDRAQYGLAAVLAVVGVGTVVDSAGLGPGFADQVVRPAAFGYVIGSALVVLAVLFAVATARGDRAEGEAGEDVDLDQGTDWRTLAGLAGVLVATVALLELLGWAIVGALLFAGAATVLGNRHWVRNLLIGAVMSVGSWYGFYVGLGIPIPAGVLDGVL